MMSEFENLNSSENETACTGESTGASGNETPVNDNGCTYHGPANDSVYQAQPTQQDSAAQASGSYAGAEASGSAASYTTGYMGESSTSYSSAAGSSTSYGSTQSSSASYSSAPNGGTQPPQPPENK